TAGNVCRLKAVGAHQTCQRGAGQCIPSHVPLGKAGERSSILYSAGQFFFEYLVVVSLKKMSDGRYEPKITYQFPKRENLLKGQKEEEERLLQAIPLFCFPDGNNWEPVTTFPSETFSFVLTNVDGSRKIGYCRRLLPAGRGARLPEVFCIISCLGCFGLFSKILDEVEKRRQISMAVIYPFMQGLRESPFPAPGKRVTIKSFIPESGTEVGSGDSVPSVLLQHGAVCMEVTALSHLTQCTPPQPHELHPHWSFMAPFAFQVGDEEEILPIKLQNEMLASLNRHNNNNNIHTSEQLNALISEAFVQFFVRLVGHYSSHIKWSKNGLGSFQERAFCKAIASKTNRRFVKKFVKTNMFSLFIEDAEKSRIPQEAYFQQKITEYQQQKKHRRES
uniref:UDENN domain-containing protein n=1 Tax=Pavo cristatus TaxID=9049 RepID=A0A8C9L8W6_PAVCR